MTSRLQTTSMRVLAVAALVTLAHAIHAADPEGGGPTAAPGAQTQARPAAPDTQGTPSTPVIQFVPPDRGRPSVRLVSGGTRSMPRQRTVLRVLSPRQEGISASSQPSFYWYVSSASDASVEFSVKHDNAIDPLLEIRLPAPARAGIYSARLVDFGLALEPGERYEWSVELMETDRHSKNQPYSSSTVAVSLPDAAVSKQIAELGLREKARLLARHGYWYDAFDTLYLGLANHVDPAQAEHDLSELLDQVGLAGDDLVGR